LRPVYWCLRQIWCLATRCWVFVHVSAQSGSFVVRSLVGQVKYPAPMGHSSHGLTLTTHSQLDIWISRIARHLISHVIAILALPESFFQRETSNSTGLPVSSSSTPGPLSNALADESWPCLSFAAGCARAMVLVVALIADCGGESMRICDV
jgi:hypothetical protein